MEAASNSGSIPFVRAIIQETKAAESINKDGLPIEEGKLTARLVIGSDQRFNVKVKPQDSFFSVFFDTQADTLAKERKFVSLRIKEGDNPVKKVSVNIDELAERLHLKPEEIREEYRKGQLEDLINSKVEKLKKSFETYETIQPGIEEKKRSSSPVPETLKDPKKVLKIAKYFSKRVTEDTLNAKKFDLSLTAFYKDNVLHIHEQINYRRVLGSGAQGVVGKVFYLNIAEYAALKSALKPNDLQQAADLDHEIEILMHLAEDEQHEGIQLIPFAVIYEGKSGMTKGYLAHLYPLGSLDKEKARVEVSTMKEEEMLKKTKVLIHALNFMQEKRVVHGDIKPENFLMGANKEIVFADFGTAQVFRADENKPMKYSFTPRYTILNESNEIKELVNQFNKQVRIIDKLQQLGDSSNAGLNASLKEESEKREVLREQIFNARARCDVYATGAALHQILTGRSHLAPEELKIVEVKIDEYNIRFAEYSNPEISSSFNRSHLEQKEIAPRVINLIERMVDPNPETRISASEAKKLMEQWGLIE